jgi:hypothetical protein
MVRSIYNQRDQRSTRLDLRESLRKRGYLPGTRSEPILLPDRHQDSSTATATCHFNTSTLGLLHVFNFNYYFCFVSCLFGLLSCLEISEISNIKRGRRQWR